MPLRPTDLLRYALWLGVVNTANANRKYFGLPTTWVFHLTLNSLFLFLPELYRGASRLFDLERRGERQPDLVSTVAGAIQDVVVDDPDYALYVAPVALAYTVSHPRFNIYKGDWAKLRFLGFGLDAIPHSTTAFGFATLIFHGLAALRRHTPRDAPWRAAVVWGDAHSEIAAGALLVGASAVYELGEYEIHNEELRETGGDESKINMEWSAVDTVFDLMSNTLGWLAAVMLRRRRVTARTRVRRSCAGSFLP